MRKIIILSLFAILAFVNIVKAQAPNAIPYQGVARNAAGNILAAQPISLRVSIHDISALGTVVFSETHAVTTTALGLFNVNIGSGTAGVGTLAAVNWGGGAKFIQVEMDATGGTSYADMGTTQLNSVPYALHAGNANSGNFVDLTTNQTVAESKTFSSDLNVNGITVGRGAGNISSNTANGQNALQNSTYGSENTANGQNALQYNVYGWDNTATRVNALQYNNSGGNYNTANGAYALNANTFGYQNTATGAFAMNDNTTGYGNTAMGKNALTNNTTGNYNTAIGWGALTQVTTGFGNTACGDAAGAGNY